MEYLGGYMETANEPIDDSAAAASLRQQVTARAMLTETLFLSILRYSVLLVAAIALVATAAYLGIGAFRQIGQTAVNPDPVALATTDVAPEAQSQPASTTKKPAQPKMAVTSAVKKATARLYRTKFKKFQRSDAKIDEPQIVDFIWTEDRISTFDELAGRLEDTSGKILVDTEAVMLNAISLTSAATSSPPFEKRLAAFRDAKKVNVCNEQIRSRRRTIATWDTYATNCPYWYESPVGCASTRVVSEPYSERVCKMQFPDDIDEPAVQMAQSIEQYAVIASVRLNNAAIAAEEATAENNNRKAEGRQQIETAGKLFLGFLALMFLYLFVAMERHHRNIQRFLSGQASLTDTKPDSQTS